MCIYIPHVKVRSESVHVDVSILLQLCCKLWSEGRVQAGRKVTESVLQRLLFGGRVSQRLLVTSETNKTNLLFFSTEHGSSRWSVGYTRIPATLQRREGVYW